MGNKIILVKNSNWLGLKIQNAIVGNKISYNHKGPCQAIPGSEAQCKHHGATGQCFLQRNPFYKQTCTRVRNTLSWLMMGPHTVTSVVAESEADLHRSSITLKIAIISREEDPI